MLPSQKRISGNGNYKTYFAAVTALTGNSTGESCSDIRKKIQVKHK